LDYEVLRKEIKEKQNQLKEELTSLGQNFFKEAVKAYFEEFPFVKAFAWRQYTPYFNDGDACIFGVDVDYPAMLFEGEENDFDNQWGGEYYISPWNKPESDYTEKDKAFTALRTILSSVDVDVYQAMFGDHIRVIVTRDKIETEYLEHD
jgi:hypothetical protein